MRNKSDYFCSVIQGSVFLLSLFISKYYYFPLILILTITVIFSILNKLGRGIVLRELIGLHGCIFCLLMPWMGYEWYTKANFLSRLWVSFMPVNDTVYFSFVLPAMAGFITALCWPVNKRDISDEGKYLSLYLERAKKALVIYPHIGLVLIITGIFFLYIGPYLPESLQYPANLLYTSAYAGFLYIYFNKTLPYRKIAILFFTIFICAKALGGMFTEIAYMGVTIFSFFFIGKKIAMWKKTLIFFLGIFFLVILQSVKLSYRKVIWDNNKGFNDSKAVLFSSIAAEKITNASSLLNADVFFPIYVRFNQGFNVALVIKHFTLYKTYDNGSQLLYNAASSFVPRFLWPDKPVSGGKANMLYYAGYKIDKWSTNVGPLGEAYGSFGVNGGIFYMFLLGLFIRLAYQKIFMVSKNIPLLLFWIPLLFFQVTYSLETDTLQILNSLFKASFFIWLFVKLLPWLFGIVKEQAFKKRILKASLE